MKSRIAGLLMVVVAVACSDHTTPDTSTIIAMRFVSMFPSSVATSIPFSASVELIGPDGERATDATTPVSLSLIGVGTLTGATTATPEDGVATFTDLRVSAASDALQLRATAGGIVVTSPAFRALDSCAPRAAAYPLSISVTFATSCFVDGTPAIHFGFTKPDAGPLRISAIGLNGARSPDLTLLNEPPSDGITIPSDGASTTGNWILPAASYRLRVTNSNGLFSITSSTSPPAGCVVQTLLPFALITYGGRIEPTDCAAAAINSDVYQVYSPKPCAMVMRGVAATVDAMLTIRNARTHATIVQDDNSGGGVSGKDAFITLTECRAGTDPIEIVAATTTAQSGDYTFALQITGGVSTFLIGNGAER